MLSAAPAALSSFNFWSLLLILSTVTEMSTSSASHKLSRTICYNLIQHAAVCLFYDVTLLQHMVCLQHGGGIYRTKNDATVTLRV